MVVTGIIRPPPEIRAVADRTALYVAKNGRTFETRILNSAKGKSQKFAFLHATSPFHMYYEDRIQFYENGGEDKKDDDDDKKKEEEKKDEPMKDTTALEQKKKTTQKASAIDPIAKALLVQRTKIADFRAAQEEAAKKQEHGGKPPASVAAPIPLPLSMHLVNIVAPASVTVVQLETMQLVAQFAALSSISNVNFLQQLTHREWNNPMFAFCQPRHGHFAYFSALVDAYRRILGKWKDTKEGKEDEVKELANNVDKCLEVAAYRAEYHLDMEEQRKQNEEGPMSALIDWHDFVVVETIDFAPDEVVELSMLPPPPPPPPPPSAKEATVAATKPKSDEMEVSDEDNEDDEPIRVVPSYTPKLVAAGAAKLETVVDPISGKIVNVQDMPEHMRIQLLDPKWAEERKKFQDKQKESNLVSGDVVASNIERFAQARGDQFGKKEQDLLSQEAESKKRLDEANRIIRDQAQSQNTVGPTLPGQRKAPPPPDSTTSAEPVAKRPRVGNVTYAPSLVAAPVPPPPPPIAKTDADATVAAVAAPAPTPVSNEESFAAAATGALPVQAESITTTTELLPEAQFAASLSKPEVTLQIRIPNDPSQMAWNFYGQIVSVTVNVLSKVKAVKSEISSTHLNSMPANKIQLKNPSTGAFLKDAQTLAALNIGPSATLELVPRARGGKKK